MRPLTLEQYEILSHVESRRHLPDDYLPPSGTMTLTPEQTDPLVDNGWLRLHWAGELWHRVTITDRGLSALAIHRAYLASIQARGIAS